MWRGVGMIFVAVVMHRVNKLDYSFSDPIEFRKLMIRNILCGIQSFAISLSLLYIPQSNVHTIVNCGPLCIFVVDYFMNHSTISRRQLVGLIVSFIGIILTVNMNLLSEYFKLDISHESTFNYIESSGFTQYIIILFLVISTVLWSVGMVQTKDLRSGSYAITFHIGVMLVMINGIVIMFGGYKADHWSITSIISNLFWVGITLGVSNWLQTIAVKMQKSTGNVTMIGLWSVILGYILSIVRYKEQINPIGLLGSILIISGVVLVLYK